MRILFFFFFFLVIRGIIKDNVDRARNYYCCFCHACFIKILVHISFFSFFFFWSIGAANVYVYYVSVWKLKFTCKKLIFFCVRFNLLDARLLLLLLLLLLLHTNCTYVWVAVSMCKKELKQLCTYYIHMQAI